MRTVCVGQRNKILDTLGKAASLVFESDDTRYFYIYWDGNVNPSLLDKINTCQWTHRYNSNISLYRPFDIHIPPNSKVILIPSIIHVQFPGRNLFSSEERLQQTIQQIQSIKQTDPTMIVILLEMSNTTGVEKQRLHTTPVDYIVHYTHDPILQRMAHCDPNKGKSELYVILNFMKTYSVELENASHIAKFGGRYYFTDKTNPVDLFRDIPVFTIPNNQAVETQFYTIPKSYFVDYAEFIDEALHTLEIRLAVIDEQYNVVDTYLNNIENIMYLFCKVFTPQKMHIEGLAATSRELCKI
jgi:hypothetical protein